jgi:SAM-dependent methyltransferase
MMLGLDRARELFAGLADRLPMSVAWRSWVARRRGAAFDRRYGTDTQTHVAVEALGIDAALARHAVHYEPSALPKIERAMRQLPIRHDSYSFIDIGAGKGLAALVASRYPFRRVIGVEASSALCGIARRNLALYERHGHMRAPVEFLNLDALEYRFPDEPLVVYLYNPFDEHLLARLIGALLARRESKDYVVYVNPVHRFLFEASALEAVSDERALAIYRHRDVVGAPYGPPTG